MIDEEVVIKQFMSYCQKILKCEKIDYYRERKYRAEHEVHLEMLGDYETEVHGTLKVTYYDAFRVARQEINSGIAGMEVQGGFDVRA